MTISLAGVVGALIGLAVGWLDWKMVSGILRQKHVANSMTLPAAERAKAERRLGLILKGVFMLCFVGIPLVGYLTGAAIGG